MRNVPPSTLPLPGAMVASSERHRLSLKERAEVGKYSRQKELFRNLAKQENIGMLPYINLSEELLGSEGCTSNDDI